jgi:hypothetical protein
MSATDRALQQRERIERWTGEGRPVPAEQTAMDRHVNRAWELARSDNLPRIVYYTPDNSGLIHIDKRATPPAGVTVYVLVDGKSYPRMVRV